MPTLQEAVVRHGPGYIRRFGAQMPEWHLRALERLAACRTFEAGRCYYQCECCGGWQMIPSACGHRACAQCGLHKAQEWEAKQQARLLPVPYVMVTFTLPSALRPLFRQNQKICYHLFMQESAGTLQEIARDPRHLGGEIGATGVLHTWRRDLGYHPHIHYLVPAGGLGAQGWITPKKPDYFLPSAVLATRMRNRLRDRLRREHPELWRGAPAGAWEKPWNVNVQFVGQGETAFRYLARYVQSTAIRNSRILKVGERTVTYTWTERESGHPRRETVSGEEFLRRFLQHVLPKGLTRVRHIGYLSAAAKKTFAAVRAALGLSEAKPAADPSLAPMTVSLSASASEPMEQGPAPEPKKAATVVRCMKCKTAMKFLEFRGPWQSSDPEELHRRDRQEPASREPAPKPKASAPRQAASPTRGPPKTAKPLASAPPR